MEILQLTLQPFQPDTGIGIASFSALDGQGQAVSLCLKTYVHV